MTLSTLCKAGLLATSLLTALAIGVLAGNHFRVALVVAQDSRSMSRFSQIEAALLLYHQAHGRFPPTRHMTEEGVVHSWRVLLLPHIHETGVYTGYDFSRSWDDTENLSVVDGGGLFASIEADATEHIANYLSIGPGDVWPWRWPMKSYCVVKGDDRFWLVEDPNSTVHWMEPRF